MALASASGSKQQKQQDFFRRVYTIVAQIPYGKVTTYGHIAKALGLRSSARMVGWAMNAAISEDFLPCHRVVNRNGELSGKMHFPTPTYMREMLEAEGVAFTKEAVDMDNHLWIPPIDAE